MSGHNKQLIRKILLSNPDGLTLRQISKSTGISIDSCINSLKRCYGCYVAGWQQARPEHRIMAQVWKCVQVPKNAPKPKTKQTDEERKEYQAEYRMKMRNKQLDQSIRNASEAYQNERKLKKPIRLVEQKKKQNPVLTSTGLTTIRGPWPVWN